MHEPIKQTKNIKKVLKLEWEKIIFCRGWVGEMISKQIYTPASLSYSQHSSQYSSVMQSML